MRVWLVVVRKLLLMRGLLWLCISCRVCRLNLVFLVRILIIGLMRLSRVLCCRVSDMRILCGRWFTLLIVLCLIGVRSD